MQMCVYLRVYSKKEAKCFEHLRLHEIIQSFLPIYMDYKYIYIERERERDAKSPHPVPAICEL